MFTTKKYTRPALRAAVRSVNVNNFANLNAFTIALSPRAGRYSAQMTALRSALLENKVSLKAVFSAASSKSQTKAYLLNLLK